VHCHLPAGGFRIDMSAEEERKDTLNIVWYLRLVEHSSSSFASSAHRNRAQHLLFALELGLIDIPLLPSKPS
jgi:hypothetical protein